MSCTCQSNGITAVTTPESPPITNVAMNPSANSSEVVRTGRPAQSVAIQAKIWMVEKSEMVMLAAAKKLIAIWFIPMANMWWTQTPIPTMPVSTVEAATQG